MQYATKDIFFAGRQEGLSATQIQVHPEDHGELHVLNIQE